MRVIETSMDEDLSLFSRYLWQQRVRHRVFEERGCQVLEIADTADQELVRSAYAAWSDGRLVLEAVPVERGESRISRALRDYPGLACLVGIAVLLFPFTAPLADGHVTAVAAQLTIVDLARYPDTAPAFGQMLGEWQCWRWLLPVFIHFGVLHLIFNCAVVIELGRRIERGLGAWQLWLIVVLLGVVSNLGQYAMNPHPLFGGLSGVAYGLLGFVMVMQRLLPDRTLWHLAPGLSGSLLFFLVLFSTGITEGFGLLVANSAHWFGLLTGAFAAFVTVRMMHVEH